MKLETSEGEREEAQRWYNKDAFFVRAARALRAPIPAPLLPTEDQVARGVAAIEREWPASVSEPYPGTPAVTLRPGEKPVELDDLVRTVLAAAGPPAPPLPAEVEEMRKRLEYAAIDIVRRQGGMDMGAEIIPLMLVEDAASLLSRWPGRWRGIETAPKDGTEILIGRKGECPRIVVTYEKDNDPEFPWALMADSSVNFAASWPTHWSPLPEPPNE